MDNNRQNIAYFLSFCIEQYVKSKGLGKEKVLALFSDYGVLEYLAEHFEILHTQNRQWIVEEIDEYIEDRKGCLL